MIQLFESGSQNLSNDTTEPDNKRAKVIVAMIAGMSIAATVGVLVYIKQSNGSGNLNFRNISIPIIAVGVLMVGMMFIFIARRKNKRRVKSTNTDQLSSLGLTQLENGEEEIKRRFSKLPALRHKGSIKKVFRGTLANRELFAFSHVYTMHTGQAPITVNTTIYAVKTPDWPKTNIVPANWITQRIGALFGRRSMKLDLPEFNRRFRVTTADESFAITLLSPELQKHILDKTSAKWRIVDGWLCLIYSGPLKLSRTPVSLRRLERFIELIPPELESWTNEVSV